jgi:predicted DNA-binding transcriptional regulator AlpA
MTPTATPTLTDVDDPRPFVSADEAFAFLGIDRTTGYRAIHENTFPVPSSASDGSTAFPPFRFVGS